MLVDETHSGDHDGETGKGLSFIAKYIVICLAFDAKDSIYSTGSSMYEHSCLRQWLNSTAAQGEAWFVPSVDTDNPPTAANVTQNPYATDAGFLNGFDVRFRNVLKEVQKPYVFQQQAVTGPAEKIFIPSVDELYGDTYSYDSEGDQYAGFIENPKLRIAYLSAEDETNGEDPWMYWTRTAWDTGSLTVIDGDGYTSDGCTACTGAVGVRPGFVLNGW